ncbi:hypothetical protein JXJ21_15845 [candidate division KSB1 bacterium]|nr:hypothetical protein [candidate division KSB1 bacterium]
MDNQCKTQIGEAIEYLDIKYILDEINTHSASAYQAHQRVEQREKQLIVSPELNEAFRRIKQRILHGIRYQRLKSLIITPIIDLKDFREISFKLASSVEYSGDQRILLVDCNLANPAKYVKTPNGENRGLIQLVHNQAGINEVLQKTENRICLY